MTFQIWEGEHISLINKTSVSIEIRTFNVALFGNGKCWEKGDCFSEACLYWELHLLN